MPFAMLCLAGAGFAFWIAFHDINTLLQGQPPTVSNVSNLVTQHFTKAA